MATKDMRLVAYMEGPSSVGNGSVRDISRWRIFVGTFSRPRAIGGEQTIEINTRHSVASVKMVMVLTGSK